MTHEQAFAHPPPKMDCSGELLTPVEQRMWFEGCVFIKSMGGILTPDGHYMNEAIFNATYGGKKFIVDQMAKVANNAWGGATMSTLGTIPKVDFVCFRTDQPTGLITTDDMGQSSVNTYRFARIEVLSGDPTPFLRHLSLLFPDDADRHIILSFMAHNAKYPGHKIPWAPLLQSCEGAGKNVIKYIMAYVMGTRFSYAPKARELNSSGSKFNAWMAEKLFIIVDEVKTDEKRELTEVLKDLISEDQIEIQGKGVDQRQADNLANWIFFTNHKDAIPIEKNGRRWAILYSRLQSEDELSQFGMTQTYFTSLYGWLGRKSHQHGLRITADYLLNYPIERGAIPMRAPETSSKAEALTVSRGAIEQAIAEAVGQDKTGFRGGWISRIKAKELFKRDYSTQAITKAITGVKVKARTRCRHLFVHMVLREWVRHTHEDRVELHLCTPSMELHSGRSLNIAPRSGVRTKSSFNAEKTETSLTAIGRFFDEHRSSQRFWLCPAD